MDVADLITQIWILDRRCRSNYPNKDLRRIPVSQINSYAAKPAQYQGLRLLLKISN